MLLGVWVSSHNLLAAEIATVNFLEIGIHART